MKNENKKRKTLFIQKKFQLKSIASILIIIAASGLLSGLIFYFLLASELSSELHVAHSQIKNTWDSLAPVIVFGNIITIIVVGIAAAIVVLYQSHKIAGPLYRIQTICDDVAKGNYDTMTSLRKDDQLTSLAQSFESMLTALQEKDTKRKEAITIVIDLVKTLEEGSLSPEQLKTLTSIKQIVEGEQNN